MRPVRLSSAQDSCSKIQYSRQHPATKEYHLKAFGHIADSLEGYTEKCVISFVDEYAKNKKNLLFYCKTILSNNLEYQSCGLR